MDTTPELFNILINDEPMNVQVTAMQWKIEGKVQE